MRGTSVDANTALAFDAGALASLKAQASRAPAEALSKAAGQFEALFVSMVLKSMRDALPQDGPLASETTKTYTTMFDQQLALKLSDRGIGLRKQIEKQLSRSLPQAASAAGEVTTAPATSTTPTMPVQPPPSPMTAPARRAAAAYTPPNARAADIAATSATTTPPAESGGIVSAVSTFIDKLRPQAEAAAKALGVPVQFLIAQAGLETGWGKSQPKTTDGGSSHNLFGVKAGRRWSGSIVAAKTTEYVAGNATQSSEQFRAYGSYAESFQDFVRLLKGNRYAQALANGDDASRYAKSLQRAGYATDPAYAEKLTRAIALVTRHTGSSLQTQVLAGGADTRSDRA